ncbi:MAG: hypothetical protein MMC33_004045 [Icmadophila ericetorum]|nr:hypothetical protein [Icmadophila ericetorum]
MDPSPDSTPPPPPIQTQTRVPDWETSRTKHPKSKFSNPQTSSINFPKLTALKSHLWTGTYHTYPRRTLTLITITIIITILLALSLGLGIGLSKRKHSSQFLPLPSDKQSFTGDLTYYAPGLGACGVTSTANQDIVSVSHFLFDSVQVGTNPNTNPLCGLVLRAERFDDEEGVDGMRSVDLTVVDRCTGCAPTDLDVSLGVFSQLANPAQGRVTVTWAWLSPTPTPQ